MNNSELDQLDSEIARIEGRSVAHVPIMGGPPGKQPEPYRPTRDPDEALRLVEKYIARVIRLDHGWAAIGPNGRACTGPTLPIAVCMAVVEAS